MGRIKTKKIKGLSNRLMAQYADKIATTFEENKKIVASLSTVRSKKLRNVIAGYCTRLKKRKTDL